MIFLKKKSLQAAASLLCIAALPASSLSAQECCSNEEDCCLSWASLLLPLAAGAGTSAAVVESMKKRGRHGKKGHHGKNGASGSNGLDGQNGANGQQGYPGKHGSHGSHGHRGETGPKGDTGDFCVDDVGQALTFGFNLTILPNEGYTPITFGEIIPFVETPMGEVIEGEPLNPNLTSTIQPAMFTITNPCYGTYHFGYFLPTVCGSTGTAALDINNLVQATRDGSSTIYIEEIIWDPSCFINQQVTFDYTYFISEVEGG